jgi:hypothetical protein
LATPVTRMSLGLMKETRNFLSSGTGRLTGDEDCSQRQGFSFIPMIILSH